MNMKNEGYEACRTDSEVSSFEFHSDRLLLSNREKGDILNKMFLNKVILLFINLRHAMILDMA